MAVVAGLLILGSVVGYFVVNHVIRSQLASLVRKNLDGELVGGSVSYRPPLGFVVRNAKVVRGDGRGGKVELFHIDQLDCKLDKLPGGSGPVLIESLVVKGPSVRLVTEEREKGPPEPCSDCPSEPTSKLSEKVQIRHLRVEGGSLSWQDRNHPDAPNLTLWNVSANVEPAKSAGGAQPFQIFVKDGPTDLRASGNFQGDELLLGLDDLALNVRLDPAATQNPLPASVAELARRYEMKGALSLHGKGEVPLNCPQLSTFDGALEVADASARPPGADAPVEKIRLNVVADSSSPPAEPAASSETFRTSAASASTGAATRAATRPAPAAPATPPAPVATTSPASPALPGLHAKLAYCEASYAGASVKIDGGEFSEDRARGTWRVAKLAGHFIGSIGSAKPEPRANARPEAPPAGGPSQARAKGPSSGPSTAPSEPEEPGAPPGAPILRGRIDFTAAAGGPLRGIARRPSASAETTRPAASPGATKPTGVTRATGAAEPPEPLHYEIMLLPRDLAFQPGGFPVPVEHIGGGMIRVSQGSATITGLAGTYGGDKMALDRARVPLPDDLRDLSRIWTLETRIEEMSGTLTCYQPGPIYPRGINSVFHTLHPQGTVAIGGRITLNHRLPQPARPKPKDDYAIDITGDGGISFALTDLAIPITHVRGRAAVDPLDIVIGTDGLHDSVVEGHSMGGTVSVHMNVSPRSDREPAVYRGEGWLRDVNMILLCKLLDVKDQTLSHAGGKGYLHANFTVQGAGSPRPPLDTLRGQGELEIIGANFWEDPVVGPIAASLRGGKPGAGEPSKTQQGLGDAAAVFHVANRVITLDRAAVNSPTVGIQGSGTVTFDKQLNLELVATPIGNLKAAIKQSAPNPVGEVAGDIAGVVQGVYRAAAGSLLYQYRVTGPADHPKRELVPAPILTDPAAVLFGRMADPKDGDLLDAVRSAASSRGGKGER